MLVPQSFRALLAGLRRVLRSFMTAVHHHLFHVLADVFPLTHQGIADTCAFQLSQLPLRCGLLPLLLLHRIIVLYECLEVIVELVEPDLRKCLHDVDW